MSFDIIELVWILPEPTLIYYSRNVCESDRHLLHIRFYILKRIFLPFPRRVAP